MVQISAEKVGVDLIILYLRCRANAPFFSGYTKNERKCQEMNRFQSGTYLSSQEKEKTREENNFRLGLDLFVLLAWRVSVYFSLINQPTDQPKPMRPTRKKTIYGINRSLSV